MVELTDCEYPQPVSQQAASILQLFSVDSNVSGVCCSLPVSCLRYPLITVLVAVINYCYHVIEI